MVGVLTLGISCAPAPSSEVEATDASTLTTPTPDPLATERQRALNGTVGLFLADNGNPQANDPFKSAFIDLNQDGVLDALVLLGSSNWCGSGGCTLLVFQGEGDGVLMDQELNNEFRLVSKITLVQQPVIVSTNQTNGWRDLLLQMSGGGAPVGTVALQFDGEAYPSNPSMLEPLPANATVEGDSLFSPDVPFRAIGDDPRWEDACRTAIAAQYKVAADTLQLQFARADEGGAAYQFTLEDGSSGLCRASGDGTVDYIQPDS